MTDPPVGTGRVLVSHLTCWPEVNRGAERYIHELSAALTGMGHQVTILSTASKPGRSEILGVPVVTFPTSRPSVFAARCLAYAARTRVDVWHANGLYDGAAATMRLGAKAVLTLHGPLAPQGLGRGRRAAFELTRRGGTIVCVSEAAASRVRSDWKTRARVVPPGVDLEQWTPGGSRASHPVVLYAGTLSSPRKNVRLLLEAAARARTVHPDLEVWLAGGGEPPAVPAEMQGHVRHLGSLSGTALREAYRQAWVTALVSEREVFGMCVVEAMACGTPALVLDDGWGPAGIVTAETGVRGPADVGGMGDALVRALELALMPTTATACRSAAERYGWSSRIGPEIMEVYRCA